MKKSFMTRALATGLSFAMAFSLSAATNVTTASAAAKKTTVTKLMKVSEKTVTEGKSVTTYMNSTATKKYRIKSHTETATAKKYISVVMTKSRKGLTITAKDGALAAVNLEKKGVNVKINFAPATTVAKVKKTAATKYVNLKVVVKAKPVEKLTMTADATGVKKIAVTFNKAVDTTATKIVVKKATATPAITSTTFATDAKSAELAMGTKLTAGTYTVEATVGEEKLTANITVEDEKMTEFKLVSPNLVADPDVTTKATISYKAVNQYGEAMPASKVSASCSFGKIETLDEPKADKNGKITVTDIPTTLAVDGQTGTLVIVNQENGVNLNETITYRSKAVASSADVLGIYSTKTDKLIEGNLKVNATAGDYQILVNIQDQYNGDMDLSAIEKSKCDVSLNPAKVLTDLDLNVTEPKVIKTGNASDKTYDGKSCIAIPLKADAAKIAKAGTLSLTIVSANKGVLATPSFVVDDVVLIESYNVSAADTIYNAVKNKLVVEAYDVNGNAVTKYDDLKIAFDQTINTTKNPGTPITIEKNSDGTATFYYTPSVTFGTTNKQNTSIPQTVMFYANEATSGKYLVKPVTLTVYEAKVPVKVAGVANDAITAVAVSKGAILSFDMTKLTIEDQYSNTKGYSDLNDTDKANVTVYLKDNADIFQESTASVSDKKIKLTSNGIKGDATLYLKYQTTAAGGDGLAANENNYDLKLTLSAVDVSNLTASDMTLKVNDGNKIYGANKVRVEAAMDSKTIGSSYDETAGAVVTCSAIVTAKVAGKNVVVPTHMYTIIDGASLGEYGKVNNVSGGVKIAEKTEEKTVKVVYGDAGKEVVSTTVTVSNADAKAVEIKKNDSKKVSNVGTGLADAIKIVDQYGNTMTGKSGDIVYTITFTGKDADTLQDRVKKNGTQAVNYVGTFPSGATASVTYAYAGLTFTTDVEF